MKYLDYYLTDGEKVTLNLNETLKKVIPKTIFYKPMLLKYICNRPEINKSVFLDITKKYSFTKPVYLELKDKDLKEQTTAEIILNLSNQLSNISSYIDLIKRKKEEEQQNKKTTKDEILENIKNLQLKIKKLNPLDDDDLEQIQKYLEEIKRQKKGLKREDARVLKRTNEIISIYYDDNIYKLEEIKEIIERCLIMIKEGD